MTDAERNLVVECLEIRRKMLSPLSPLLTKETVAMLGDLIERFKAAKVSDSKPAPAPTTKTTVATRVTRNLAVKEAQEQIERIVEMCEQVAEYDSSSAQDFASSVQEKTESIGRWIDEYGDVTEKQQEALDNMESGISRWIR